MIMVRFMVSTTCVAIMPLFLPLEVGRNLALSALITWVLVHLFLVWKTNFQLYMCIYVSICQYENFITGQIGVLLHWKTRFQLYISESWLSLHSFKNISPLIAINFYIPFIVVFMNKFLDNKVKGFLLMIQYWW